MACERHLVRGAVAGIAAGVAASWVMNVFISKLGKNLTEALMSEEDRVRQQQQQKQQEDRGEPQEDATMKAAEAITHTVTGGRHLSHEQREKAGPMVHYGFGAATGGLYGALAECSGWTSVGFGTLFGVVLYLAADMAAVPAFGLAPPPTEQPLAAQATPLAAHLVYGATTDLLRRAILALT